MGGTGSSSQKTMVNAATNTETKTYAQAGAQTHAEEKGKGPKTSAVTPEESEVFAHLPQRFPFVEDLSEYEEEGGEGIRNRVMAKAVVIHGVPTNLSTD